MNKFGLKKYVDESVKYLVEELLEIKECREKSGLPEMYLTIKAREELLLHVYKLKVGREIAWDKLSYKYRYSENKVLKEIYLCIEHEVIGRRKIIIPKDKTS